MSDPESFAARQALNLSTFTRLKDLVRELEDNEKRVGRDLATSQIEFRLDPDEMAWFVAYKTSMPALENQAVLTAKK